MLSTTTLVGSGTASTAASIAERSASLIGTLLISASSWLS
jgi:hypothetical protein